jgi:hypothetical protein
VIVADEGATLRLVTQNDHAALSADLLGAWRSIADLPERRLLLEATRRHDNGWRETDAAPRIDARGRPRDFLAVEPAERRRLWERGMDRYRDHEPACALLIVEHAIWLHRDAGDDPEIAALAEGARERREDLLSRIPSGRDLVERLYPWLRLADDLSLRICWGRDGAFELDATGSQHGGWRGRLAAAAGDSMLWNIELAPFPLAGTTTFRFSCRHIPNRHYRDDPDLASTLLESRWLEARARLLPATG